MLIRLATPADLPDLYRLWCQLMDQHQAYHPIFGYHASAGPQLQQMLRGRLTEPYTRIFVAGDEAGRLAGLLLTTYQVGSSGMKFFRRGYLAETIVAAGSRRRGLGRALVEAAKAWLVTQGADHLELQVSVLNEGALRFWQAQGFTVTTQHLVLPLPSPPSSS